MAQYLKPGWFAWATDEGDQAGHRLHYFEVVSDDPEWCYRSLCGRKPKDVVLVDPVGPYDYKAHCSMCESRIKRSKG